MIGHRIPSPPATLDDDVRRALAEDVGSGDLAAASIPATCQVQATVCAREPAVLCGTRWFDATFQAVDERIRITWHMGDSNKVQPGDELCRLTGPARGLFTAERTALNFLQLLSAIATTTRQYVQAVAGTGVTILDTRKTLPGLRAAQKYAVCCGGGTNHRMGLFDAAMLKENHIHAAGGVTPAVQALRKACPDVALIVEVESLAQLEEALAAGADRLLLDNFPLDELAEAVRRTQGRATLEASGGISLTNVRAVAETGVDCISVGALTKDIRALDLSLRYVETP